MSRVTVKTIAEVANVSIGTVDRALNNRGRIMPETKQKILRVAESLGYRTNHIASALSKKFSFRIAIMMAKQPSYFTDELLQGFDSAQKELQDYDLHLDYFFSESLAFEDQLPIIQAISPANYDAVAINAGSEKLLPYINSLISQGVRVATFNSDVPNSNRLFYVGENPYMGGSVAAELMGKIIGGKGDVAVLAGFSLVGSHRSRSAGFIDYFRKHYPDVQLMENFEYHDHEDEAYNAIQQIFKQKKIRGAFCVSSVGVIGVGNYLTSHLSPGEFCLIGYDINQRSAQLLQQNYCTALIYQEPRLQSYNVLHYLFNLLTGINTPDKKEYFTKARIVLCENLEDYMD